MICRMGETIPIYVQASRPDTGAASDATGSLTYRVYEMTTGTPVATGSLDVLDDANTVGLYATGLVLDAGSGFEVDKFYAVRVAGTVGGVDIAGIAMRFAIRDLPSATQNATAVWSATRTAASDGAPTTYGPSVDLLLRFHTDRYVKSGETVTLYKNGTSPLLTQNFAVSTQGFDRSVAQ